MTIFCINIGNLDYCKYSIFFIEKLCLYNNINFFILNNNSKYNKYNVHPSWLKLFCHTLVEDDFILCWDLDLLPTKLFDIHKFLDTKNINLAYDQAYIRDNFTFNNKFKYNCGLLGIPKTYQREIENIYYKAKNSSYPSYEQYHVNDWIFDNNILIHNLDTKLNMMYDGTCIDKNNINYNIHYTWKITSSKHKYDLIINHYNTFKEGFDFR